MLVVQLRKRQIEKRERSSSPEMRAGNAILLGGIDHEKMRMRPADRGAAELMNFVEIVVIVDPSFVFAKIDDQLRRSLRQQPFLLMRTTSLSLVVPEHLHELGQRRRRPVVQERHPHMRSQVHVILNQCVRPVA